jgi:hypothetical protein
MVISVTLSKMTLTIMVVSMTLNKMTLKHNGNIRDIEQNDTQHNGNICDIEQNDKMTLSIMVISSWLLRPEAGVLSKDPAVWTDVARPPPKVIVLR